MKILRSQEKSKNKKCVILFIKPNQNYTSFLSSPELLTTQKACIILIGLDKQDTLHIKVPRFSIWSVQFKKKDPRQ